MLKILSQKFLSQTVYSSSFNQSYTVDLKKHCS